MRDRSPLPRTLDILEAIDRIHRYTEGMTIEDYRHDNLRRDAVERCLEIISEASKHLPDRYTSRYPDIHGGGSEHSAIFHDTSISGSMT